MRSGLVRISALVAGAALALTIAAVPAEATFPGQNGKIAFGSTSEGGNKIDTINPDGTGRTLLRSDASGPVWSADGARLLFMWIDPSPPGGIPFQPRASLRTIGADGAGEQVVFDETRADDWTWRPDGQKIAYTIATQCMRFICFDDRIFTANIDGTGAAELPNSPGAIHVDWSPDGGKLAFGGGDVGTINADGTGLVYLTTDPALDFDVSWSPDGRKIAFQSNRDGNWEIYTMNADGSNQTRLTNNPAIDEAPVWSPDGTKIAFDRVTCPDTGCCPDSACSLFDIYAMNADGTNETNITKNPPPPVARSFDVTPDWQPLPGPRRSDYRNGAKFCKAEREFLGDQAFTSKHGGGANAYGRCVSQSH